MIITCFFLLVGFFLWDPPPPGPVKPDQMDQAGKALKQLDKQLFDILEGQELIVKKYDYYLKMQIGFRLLPDPGTWDWPEELKKLDEKIFSRWKKPPSKK